MEDERPANATFLGSRYAGDTVSWRMINSNNTDRNKVLQIAILTGVRAVRAVLCGILICCARGDPGGVLDERARWTPVETYLRRLKRLCSRRTSPSTDRRT